MLLLELFNLDSSYAGATPAVQVKRRRGWRKLQHLPEPGTYPPAAIVLGAPEAPFDTRTVRSRRFLTAPDVPAGATTPVSIPTVVLDALTVKRRVGWRKLQTAPDPITAPWVTVPGSPEAARLITAHRRTGWRKLQTLPELDNYPLAPKVAGPPDLPFLTRAIRNRRFLTAPDVPPQLATPAVPIEATILLRAKRRKSRRPDIKYVELITANPAQPVSAWITRPVRRRDTTHRKLRQVENCGRLDWTPVTVTPGSGTLHWNGQPVSLALGLNPGTATLTWSGQPVTLLTTIPTGSGTITWTGQQVTLPGSEVLTALADNGPNLRWFGQKVTLSGTYQITGDITVRARKLVTFRRTPRGPNV